MYEISVRTRFSAAHHLAGHEGKCATPHGHNWDVEVYVRGETTGHAGMLLDFQELKRLVRDALADVDHADLNLVPSLRGITPSSENLARFLYDRLSASLNCDGRRVSRVTVH